MGQACVFADRQAPVDEIMDQLIDEAAAASVGSLPFPSARQGSGDIQAAE